MGFGKAVIAFFLIIILAAAVVTMFSMAYTDRSLDAYKGNFSSTNGTIIISNTIATTTTGITPGIVLIAGIVCFFSMLLIFRRFS